MNKILADALEVIKNVTEQTEVTFSEGKDQEEEESLEVQVNLGSHPTLGGEFILKSSFSVKTEEEFEFGAKFEVFHRPYAGNAFQASVYYTGLKEYNKSKVQSRLKTYLERCLTKFGERAYLTNEINFKTPDHLIPMLKLALKRGYIKAANIETGQKLDYRVYFNLGDGNYVVKESKKAEQYLVDLFKEKGLTFDAQFLRDSFPLLRNTVICFHLGNEVLVQDHLVYLLIEEIEGHKNFYRLCFAKDAAGLASPEVVYVNFDELIGGTFRSLISFFSRPEFEKVEIYQNLSDSFDEVFDLLKLSKEDGTWEDCELKLVPTTTDEGYELQLNLDQDFYMTFYKPLGIDFFRVALYLKADKVRKITEALCAPAGLRQAVLEIKNDLDFDRYTGVVKDHPFVIALCGVYLYDTETFDEEVIFLDVETVSNIRLSVPLRGKEGFYTRNIYFRKGLFKYLVTSIAKTGVLSNEYLTLEQRIGVVDTIVETIRNNNQLPKE